MNVTKFRVVSPEDDEGMARMLEALAARARVGEIQSVVGVMTLRGGRHGWLKSMMVEDVPRLMGYMEILKRDMVARFESSED